MEQDNNMNHADTSGNNDEKFVTVKEHDDNNMLAKTIGTGLLIFLGAFCAFYTVADWHMKRVFAPFPPMMMDRTPMFMDKMVRADLSNIDRTIHAQNKNYKNIIHIQENDDFYKIMIDLKAFDNNVNNVQVKRDGNILTISGRNIKKSKHKQQISEFQQSYIFDDNVKLSEMTKEVKGNMYVITIPVD